MRSRLAAALAASTLVVVPAVLVAAPANAETTIDNVTFYGEADFGVESGGYPAGVDWFFGDVAGTDGAHTFDAWGLNFNTGAPGDIQILNQNVTTPATAADLLNVLGEVDVYSVDANWVFQLPLFAEPGSTQFTTLRPSVENGVSGLGPNTYNLDLTSDWITSQAFGTYAAGDAAPLVDLLAEVYGGGAPTLLGYGFFVDDTVDATIEAIEWEGQISAFTPVVSRTFPSTISITTASTTGIPISLTGALPTVDIYLELDDPTNTRVYEDKDTPIGPDGTFATSIVLPASAPLGTYRLTFDDDSYAYGFLGLMPDDQPIEVTAAILPATGTEDAGLIAVGVLVLLGGATLVLVSRRLGRNAA